MNSENRYEKEDTIIKTYWSYDRKYVVDKLKHKSVRWIMERACKLKLCSNKHIVWTPEDDAIILKYWDNDTDKVFEYFLETRTYDSINKRASRLGVAYVRNKKWTPEEDATIFEYFKTDRNKLKSLLRHRSPVAIASRACLIGASARNNNV